MEYSHKTIKNKPSRVQRETCTAVEDLEIEQGSCVHPKDVCQKLGITKLKTIENRLQTYVRKGWLRAETSDKRDTPTLYGITDAWINLLDACDNDQIDVEAGNKIKYGVCAECGRRTRLIRFKARDICKKCLSDDWSFEYGDDTHVLVRTNWAI